MKKFLDQRIQDTTWGQYLKVTIAVYALFLGWVYKDVLLEKAGEAKEKIPSRKYIKKIEEEDFDE